MIKVKKFYAPWCGPCKILEPILAEICKDLNVKLVEIDIEENQIETEYHKIRAVPTVLILDKDDNVLETIIGGSRTKSEWTTIIEKYV